MSNKVISSNTLVTRALEALKDKLPSGWEVRIGSQPGFHQYRPDAVAEVRAPDDTKATVLVEAQPSLTARQASDLATRLNQIARKAGAGTVLVVTRFAGELARDRLRKAGLSYLDLTGNAWINLEQPGLFISSQGAAKDPSPTRRGIRSLKGVKAAAWCVPFVTGGRRLGYAISPNARAPIRAIRVASSAYSKKRI